MSEEAKEKLETRKEELKAEFEKLSDDYKTVQARIANDQRLLASIRESQLRIQGAYAELAKLEE